MSVQSDQKVKLRAGGKTKFVIEAMPTGSRSSRSRIRSSEGERRQKRGGDDGKSMFPTAGAGPSQYSSEYFGSILIHDQPQRKSKSHDSALKEGRKPEEHVKSETKDREMVKLGAAGKTTKEVNEDMSLSSAHTQSGQRGAGGPMSGQPVNGGDEKGSNESPLHGSKEETLEHIHIQLDEIIRRLPIEGEKDGREYDSSEKKSHGEDIQLQREMARPLFQEDAGGQMTVGALNPSLAAGFGQEDECNLATPRDKDVGLEISDNTNASSKEPSIDGEERDDGDEQEEEGVDAESDHSSKGRLLKLFKWKSHRGKKQKSG